MAVRLGLSLFFVLGFSAGARAGFSEVSAVDSDLSGPAVFSSAAGSVPLELVPDSVESGEGGEGLVLEVVRGDHGAATAVAGLSFSFKGADGKTLSAETGADGRAVFQSCGPAGSKVRVEAELSNRHFSVTDGDRAYRVVADAVCGTRVKFVFSQDSNGGQALGIWQIAHRGRAKLEAAVGLGFWDSTLQFVWPADADYYQWGQVHITKGHQWDVVGHEMGHGIYDLGQLGAFGGGQHKIDQCYSNALALSEGWASYYSAWLSVDSADPDAKFEYMVPRRAPIRFENVPADVCNGQSNEWRVTSFLWDLVDLSDDGEKANESFARLWTAMLNSRAGSAGDVARRFEKAGVPPALVDLVWQLNFRTSKP